MGQAVKQAVGAKASLRREAEIELERLDFKLSRPLKRHAVLSDVCGVFLRIKFDIQ